jgi:DNA-binding transcriptional LysR family regulator
MQKYDASMRPEKLCEVDLNLLTVADALLETASVTETAAIVHLSQPAVSRALGRLRAQLDDPLLVRVGHRMVRTPFADQLKPKLRHVLLELERTLVQEKRFDPSTESGTLTVATSDYATLAFLPRVLEQFQQEAPGIQIVVLPYVQPFETRLESGECDLVTGHELSSKTWIDSEPLFTSGWSCVARLHHPWFSAPDFEGYVAARHLMVSPNGQGGSPVDRVLESQGHRRNVTARVPDFAGALMIAANSDLLLSIPTQLAEAAAKITPIDYAPLPLKLRDSHVTLSWHAARTQEPRMIWFRSTVQAAVVGCTAIERPGKTGKR